MQIGEIIENNAEIDARNVLNVAHRAFVRLRLG